MELERKVSVWCLQDCIRILGPCSDVPRLVAVSNLFLFPSVGEGLGMVAVEAQATGLTVLGSCAVPSECEAVPGMVVFKPLDDGSSAWADEALRLIGLTRPDVTTCNSIVRSVPFSIDNSAASLLNIYTGEDTC